MIKFLKMAAAALLLMPVFTACDDDDSPVTPPDPVVKNTVLSTMYVTIQGNQYGGVPGSIDFIEGGVADMTTVTSDLFTQTNRQSLGDSPQHAVRYGSKIYVPMNGSNILWVLDAQTLRIIKKMQNENTVGAWAVCGSGDYVYLLNYAHDGYVTRIDTVDYAVQGTVHVGSYPYDITPANGKLYVAMSGDYMQDYADGCKVAVVDEASFSHNGEYAVGLNPTQIFANRLGELFVMCQGNYGTATPKVWKIDKAGNAAEWCDGGLCAMSGNDLYVLGFTSDYQNNVATIDSFKKYNTATNIASQAAADITLDATVSHCLPIALNIHPANGHIVICADKNPMGYAETGWVTEYEADGTLIGRKNVGIHPFGVIFK